MESRSVDKGVEVETPKEGELNENELSEEKTKTAQDVECNPSAGSNEAEAFTIFGFTFDTDKQCSTTATKSTASEGEPQCMNDTTHIISKNDLSETPISSITTGDLEKEGDVCTTEENLVNVIQPEDDNERTQSSFPIEVLSLVLPMLPKSQLLKCRLVSKKWKKVTNEYYQKSTTITFRPVYHHGLDNGFIISNTLTNLQFVQAMQNHTGNPFPKRLVTIIRTNEGVSDSIFWKSTTLLLKSFGRHIWSFAFEWENGGNLIEKCARLRNCLLLLPNLKWLSIGTVFVDKGKPVEPSLLTIFKLNKFLDKHPLPTIQSLSAIEFSPAADIPESCVHALLNNNLHVKCLIGQYEKMNTLYNLPQLEEIRMCISVKDSLLLCSPIQVNPPLKKICLQKSGFCMLNYETVFTWLHRFQNTLEELVLCCKWFIMFFKDIIELPKVKKFKLMCSELKSLRYVQGLPSLEYFEVDSLYISTLNDRQIANLETVAYQGNCWRVHENLKTIVLKGKPRYGSGREVILRYDRTTYDQRYKLWQSQQVNASEDDDVATQVLEERDLDRLDS
ncbi:unnamed protein product [Orchesella dallaii]|uniref:F-box domain-containing protein n=1 Tax=Orchesella dallaii TaxID=48710 RepID=A0ABP1RRM3_9HEXA